MKNNLAVLYGRVSTDFVRQGRSIEAQDPRLRTYCTTKGIVIGIDANDQPLVFFDAQSGTIPIWKRHGGKKVWNIINQGIPLGRHSDQSLIPNPVGHLILTSVCRLGRRASQMMAFAEHCEKIGVALHVVDEGGELDFTDPAGRMMFHFLCVIAESEQRRTAARIKHVFTHKRTKNELCGTVPYGKDAVPTGRFKSRGDGTVEIRELVDNPEEMRWLLQMIMLRRLNWGYTRIATELNRLGVQTKMAGQVVRTGPLAGQTRPSIWQAGNVKNILTNSYTLAIIDGLQPAAAA